MKLKQLVSFLLFGTSCAFAQNPTLVTTTNGGSNVDGRKSGKVILNFQDLQPLDGLRPWLGSYNAGGYLLTNAWSVESRHSMIVQTNFVSPGTNLLSGLRYPLVDGTAGYAITTDGLGVLGWSPVGGGGGSDPFAAFVNSNNVWTAVNTFNGYTTNSGPVVMVGTNILGNVSGGTGMAVFIGTNASPSTINFGAVINSRASGLTGGRGTLALSAPSSGSRLITCYQMDDWSTQFEIAQNGSSFIMQILRSNGILTFQDNTAKNHLRINVDGVRIGPSGGTITNVNFGIASLNFGNVAPQVTSNLFISVTGAKPGDFVTPSYPATFYPLIMRMVIVSNNVVNVFAYNPDTVSTVATIAETFGALVTSK